MTKTQHLVMLDLLTNLLQIFLTRKNLTDELGKCGAEVTQGIRIVWDRDAQGNLMLIHVF